MTDLPQTISQEDASALLADFEAEEVTEEEFEGTEAPEAGVDPDQEIAETEDPADLEDAEGEPEEAHAEGEEEAEAEPETPAIEPPPFLGAEGQALFAQLPAEAQTLFVQVEQQRNAGVNRKLQEAAETQKAAQAKAQHFDQRVQQISGFVTEVDKALAEYSNVDWVNEYALAGADPQAQANVTAHKAQFDRLTEQKRQAQAHISSAEQEQLKANLQALDEELPLIDPSLASPEARVQAFTEITSWAVSEGAIDKDDVPYITARQFALARDAKRWRDAQAKAKTTPRPKLDAKTSGKAVKPGATGQASSSQTSRKKKLASKKRLSQAEAASLLEDL